MTPSEKKIVKSLVAVAWADGKVEKVEEHVIEGLLAGFDASEDEEKEILEYAKERRTLEKDVPLGDLSQEDRELLLANAALLTHADGTQSDTEKALLDKLIELLGFSAKEADAILDSVRDGALQLGSRALEDVE
jgi:tellurite resistance protein